MIAIDELLRQMKGLDRHELMRWVENRWVLPERRGPTFIFHEVDVARVELILEIRQEFAIDEEALPLSWGSLTKFTTCDANCAGCATRWRSSRKRCRLPSAAPCRPSQVGKPRTTDPAARRLNCEAGAKQALCAGAVAQGG